MADEIVKKKVSELESAVALGRTDLLLIHQGNQARALPAGNLQDFCKEGVAQHEANAKTAAEAAANAKTDAENAKQAAETAQKAAETAAAEVNANAETAAKNAAEQAAEAVERTLSGHVADAQAAQKAAEAAQAAAEGAANTAANHASESNTAKQGAETAAKDAQAAASTAEGFSNEALKSRNDAFNFVNQAESAAERAAESAIQSIGADVNWRATKKILGDTLDLIPEAYIAFSNAYASVKLTETMLQPGISYVVKWNDQEYVCTCHNGDGCYYIGNGELIGESLISEEPFCIFWYDLANNTTLNVWKSNDDAETVYVHVYVNNAEYEYSKLPEEHMPESVASVILRSSTEGSTKLFKLTVDDNGTICLAEVTE